MPIISDSNNITCAEVITSEVMTLWQYTHAYIMMTMMIIIIKNFFSKILLAKELIMQPEF